MIGLGVIMVRNYMRYLAGALAAIGVIPASAYAQEDCVMGGNSAIRSAEVEFSLAASRNDTRSKEER